MDDFLGTSIQYSEQQILLLEEQYAAQQKKDVEELINSGFLDSDYESSDSETEQTLSQMYDEAHAYNEMTQLQQLQLSPASNVKVSTVSVVENAASEYCVLDLFATLMDIKSLIILFMMMVTMPPVMDPIQQISNDEAPIIRMYKQYNVYWFDAQREECKLHHMMMEDITTTAIHTDKYVKITRHQVKIKSLNVNCDENGRYVAKETNEARFFFFGAAFKSPQMKRILKETVSRGSGPQLLCKQHLTAVLMYFIVLVAVFAVSHQNMDMEHVLAVDS